MLVTQQMIFDRLTDLEKKLDRFLSNADSFSIEERSLNKACRLLKLGQETVIDLVKSGKLKARIYRDNNRKVRYRFLLKDIKTFQDSNKYDHVSLHANEVESAESIARRIFLTK